MQKSEIFNMNLFESGDPVKAEFFNENTQILESALKYLPNVVTGIFESPESADGTFTKKLTFEAAPLLVLVCNPNGVIIAIRNAEKAATAYVSTGSSFSVSCTWSGNSVTLQSSTSHPVMGSTSSVHHYLALLGTAKDGGTK